MPASSLSQLDRKVRTVLDNPFVTAHGGARVLHGVSVYSGSPRLAELAARVGFETVWIEMEHSPTAWSDAEAMCMATASGGGVPTIRVPSSDRRHVLLALEVGARIVVVPMVNHPDQARQVVRHGKFPPLGERGFNSRTRGVHYGLQGVAASSLAEINDSVHLFCQIETRQAVENLAEICAAEGVAGIFIGPGDLSLSYGWPGEFDNPKLIEIVVDIITTARAAGKLAGILVGPGPLLDAALDAGCQLVIVGGDITDLALAWPALLGATQKQFGHFGN